MFGGYLHLDLSFSVSRPGEVERAGEIFVVYEERVRDRSEYVFRISAGVVGEVYENIHARPALEIDRLLVARFEELERRPELFENRDWDALRFGAVLELARDVELVLLVSLRFGSPRLAAGLAELRERISPRIFVIAPECELDRHVLIVAQTSTAP